MLQGLKNTALSIVPVVWTCFEAAQLVEQFAKVEKKRYYHKYRFVSNEKLVKRGAAITKSELLFTAEIVQV